MLNMANLTELERALPGATTSTTARFETSRMSASTFDQQNAGSRWHRWEPHVHAPAPFSTTSSRERTLGGAISKQLRMRRQQFER